MPDMTGQVFKALAGPALTYNPEIARYLGDIRAAVLLSQALYWSDRTDSEDGSFYKTMEAWSEETAMSKYAIRQARKVLAEHDWWIEEKRGCPAKIHYRVDLEGLADAFTERDEKSGSEDDSVQFFDGPRTRSSTVPELVLRRSTNKSFEGARTTPYTETTTETTTEEQQKTREPACEDTPDPPEPPDPTEKNFVLKYHQYVLRLFQRYGVPIDTHDPVAIVDRLEDHDDLKRRRYHKYLQTRIHQKRKYVQNRGNPGVVVDQQIRRIPSWIAESGDIDDWLDRVGREQTTQTADDGAPANMTMDEYMTWRARQ